MRRLFGILIALAVPMVMVSAVALAAYRPGLPEMAQATLNRYVTRLQQLGRPATVLEMRAAGYPRSFTAALSGPTFGDGIYYGVSYVDANTPGPWPPTVTASTAFTYTPGFSPATGFSGQRPLPYPPEEIWCVRLQPDEGGAPEVVLVALHQDLYNASWAVHELPPTSVAQTLALVGCAFK
jgi:hypothetical protein